MTDIELIPPSLAIKAMRDSGYKNTAYAIAELIDNSIQAGATEVELLCSEREQPGQRSRMVIDQIAVMDNGSGMDVGTLSAALQFGNGKYLNDRSGIGRFGMGLPASSISQCRMVEVWSWQNGMENALYSLIDVRKFESGEQRFVPNPTPKPIPDIWRKASHIHSQTGTLVVWSGLDKCLWKTGSSIIRHSEFLIGRIYRRFIDHQKAKLRLAVFPQDYPTEPTIDQYAGVNDPIYLMVPSATPEPYDQKAMFQPDGEKWEVPWEIDYEGQTHQAMIRFTIAKEEARPGRNPGSTPYGQHARKNTGVSLIRADREISLDKSLVSSSEFRDRWWGVEVEFSPELDEVFGVTNNKQSASHFPEIGEMLEDIEEGRNSSDGIRDGDLEFEDDPRRLLVDVVRFVHRRVRQMEKVLRAQSRNKPPTRHEIDDDAEKKGTKVTNRRIEEGHLGSSDQDANIPQDKRVALLTKTLRDHDVSPKVAEEMSRIAIRNGLKYVFAVTNLDGNTFFSVKPVAGEILIMLNSNHPAYENLMELSEEENGDVLSAEEMADRLSRTKQGLKLLLMSWARFEDEAIPDRKRREIQDIRNEWGKFAAQFLDENPLN